MKKIICILLLIVVLSGCATTNSTIKNVVTLNINEATIDGKTINEYENTWELDITSGEETYNGEMPEDDIYIAHDIIYYPSIDESLFEIGEYDKEQEWLVHYQNDELSDYIFGTLPFNNGELPTYMMHSNQEAYNNPVLHINKEGTYVLQGEWNGQISIDLGEDCFDDENKKVELVLDGVNVNCNVGPAVIFKNVYECDNNWESEDEHSYDVDLSNAGAIVTIKDGSINDITGSNVYRLLKPEYKKEGSDVQKKRYKTDGAFYSCNSLLIKGDNNGSGLLNITSTTFEGLDSELHMTIDNAIINIVSYDDGINVNEDDVSVFAMNSGRLTIFAGQGSEGDVIDSNGYIVVNGGTILGTSPSMSDDILDSSVETIVNENATVISSLLKDNKMPFGKDMGEFMPPDRNGEFDPKNRPDGEPFGPRNGDFREDFDPNNNNNKQPK